MRLCDVVEDLSFNKITPRPEQTNELLKCYRDPDLVQLIDQFLRGIGAVHQVPGAIVHELMEHWDYYKRNEILTHKQRWFIFLTIKYNDKIPTNNNPTNKTTLFFIIPPTTIINIPIIPIL